MTKIKTYVINLGEYEKIKEILPKMENKILNAPKSYRYKGIEFHHIGETDVSLLYDGENIITIGGNQGSISQTKSRLEQLSMIKLREV